MKIFDKAIFTGFAPNLITQDIKIACAFLFFPWKYRDWRVGSFTTGVEDWLKKYFTIHHSFVFDSGRSALYYALKALGIGEGDEVLVQSFTCIVVSNAVKWTGASPVYLDINDNFNIDSANIEKKISSRTKAIIIQHTFGLPTDLKKIIEIAKKNNLKIIEDCAHAFGNRHQNKLLGTFGDIGMFSFGSDKPVSCVRGGALITNDDNLAQKIQEYQDGLPWSTRTKIFQHLMHILFFSISKPLYNLGLGKWLLVLGKNFNLYNKIIYQKEKVGRQVKFYPAKFPNALAEILYKKLDKIEKIIDQQKNIARFYHENISNPHFIKPEWNEENTWLRYTIMTKDPIKLHAFAKKKGVILGNWYDSPIAPADIDHRATGYKVDSCPKCERISSQCVNLPTDININEAKAKKIVNIINNFNTDVGDV